MSLANAAKTSRLRLAAQSALVFVAGFIFLFLFMDRLVGIYDEGIILTASMLVGAGQFIHRDFYANYGPGEFYLLAWLFDIFGHKVVVERILDLSVRAGILLLVWRATCHYAWSGVGMLATTMCACWLATVGNAGYPVYPALLLAIGSTWLVAHALRGRSSGTGRREAFVAGILGGTVGLFRYDVGFFALIAHGATAAVVALACRRHSEHATLKASALTYLLGFGLPTGAVGLFYLAHGALPGLVHDVIAFPAKYYAATRGLPFPSLRVMPMPEKLSLLSIYLPILIFASLLVGGLAGKRQLVARASGEIEYGRERTDRALFVTAFALLSLMFFLKGVVRVSVEHVQLGLIPAVIALSASAGFAAHSKLWIKLGVAGLLALVGLSAFDTLLLRAAEGRRVLWDLDWVSGYVRGAPGFVIEKTVADRASGKISKPLLLVNEDRAQALDYLIRHTAPQKQIFVGLAHHDRIFANDVSTYFLAQKLPVTKWHHFDPGLQTSQEVQQQIIDDFERVRPDFIWIESTWDDVIEPNQSRVSSGVHLLDTYIATHYEVAKAFGKIAILRRKTRADA
jgi:hypothetical protein